MSGILSGAVVGRSAWSRTACWSGAVTLMVFEVGFAASRMPAVSDVSLSLAMRPWTKPLELGLVFGTVVFLARVPTLLAGSRKPGAAR
jgi:hypothetical protein